GPIMLFGGCLATIVAVNVVVFGFAVTPLFWAPDSTSYYAWPPDPMRMPGLSVILRSVVAAAGFEGLHVVQINLMLLCYGAALSVLAAATRRYWLFVPLTVLPLCWGPFVVHGSWILSESWFI